MGSTGHRQEIRRHSGWLIPGVFLFALLLVSGLLLGWYLRPGPKSQLAPQSALVRLNLHGTSFAIPANYIEDARARSGGAMNTLALVTLFPAWSGYSQIQASLFSGNAPDSPLIRLSLRGDPNSLTASERLERIYRPHIADRGQGPFGLTHYGFLPDSSYGGKDLFAGDTASGQALFLCERTSLEFPSPNCAAVERPLAPGLSYSYRFKRAYLARWQEVSAGVDALIARFRRD